MSYCRYLISCCALWLAVGCGPGPSAGSASWFVNGAPDAPPGTSSGGWIGHQGRLLHGFVTPDIRNMKLVNVTGAHVIDGGQVVADGLAGHDLVGHQLDTTGVTGDRVAMRIADVFSPDQTAAGWQYALEQQDPGTGSWSPACAEPTPIIPPSTPPASPPRAYAMNGAWGGDGLYNVAADNVSFACATGAVGKCIEWGYDPMATPPTVTEHGLPTTATGPDLLQACSRMARADFCALGVPNTLEGTPILYDDIFRTPPEVPPGYLFEAAWPGVAYTAPPAQRPTAICLSKLRWSTLPLGGGCNLPIADPRTDSKGAFCEDLTPQQLEQLGALVYSSSSFLDAGLYTYTDQAMTNRLTTAHLLPGPVGTLPAWWKMSQPPNVPFPAAGQSTRFEATIFVPELPATIPPTGLSLLSSYRCSNDLMTTTSAPPAGCTKIADEGYVYPPNTPGHTPLRRWSQRVTHRSFTTTTAASSMIASGWQLAEVVGGVLRAEMNVNVRWSSLAGAAMSLDVLTRAGEWIAPCLDAAHVGSTTKNEYNVISCQSASRTPSRGEVAAFRVNYTVGGQTVSAVATYDDIAGDVIVYLPTGTTTAATVRWNDVAHGARYTLDVQTASPTWIHCADTNQLANDTSFVLTGSCPSSGMNVSVSSIRQIRVCTAGATPVCSQTSYDGKQPQITLAL